MKTPLTFVLLVAGVAGAVYAAAVVWRWLHRRAGVCRCGYECAGLAVCPECGGDPRAAGGPGWRFYVAIGGSGVALASAWALMNVPLSSMNLHVVHALRLVDREAAYREIFRRGWPEGEAERGVVVGVVEEIVNALGPSNAAKRQAVAVLMAGMHDGHKRCNSIAAGWNEWNSEGARLAFAQAAFEEIDVWASEASGPALLMPLIVRRLPDIAPEAHQPELELLIRQLNPTRSFHGRWPRAGVEGWLTPVEDHAELGADLLEALAGKSSQIRAVVLRMLWYVDEDIELVVYESIHEDSWDLTVDEWSLLESCHDYRLYGRRR